MATPPQETQETTSGSQRATASPLDRHTPPTASSGRRSGRAITALVLGIISIPAAFIPLAAWILGVVAIVLGATARSDIRRNGLDGHGQATAGMICGIVGVVLGIGVFIATVVATT